MGLKLGSAPKAGKHASGPRAATLALVWVACATAATPASLDPDPPLADVPVRPALSPEALDWVEETLADLDLRQRIAQLVMVWMSGGYASATDEELTRIDSLVSRHGIGGVVISLGTPLAYADRLNRLQASAEVPLLVAADFEAGPGYRIGGVYALPAVLGMGGATAFPPNMALGAIDEERVAFETGRITAREARALGVHLNFAPVLDVNNNPANPIINTRSYGEDPERVAALGTAYIRGLHAGGLLATAKHFPGHGDTETDSHVGLPVIPGDRARLDELELVPFREAIEAGVDAVMTAHVAAPGILGIDAPPATLSPYFMTELLREELDFGGVLFTDALDMAGVVEGLGDGETAVRALEAGSDVLLMPRHPVRAIEAVAAAVDSGRIAPGRIEASVRRLLEIKARAGLDRERFVDPTRVPRVVDVAAHRAYADTVAGRALTLVRDFGGTIPVDSSRTRRALALTFARPGDLAAGRAFDRRLGEALEVRSARADFGTHAEAYDSLSKLADSVDLVVVSTYVPPSSGERSVDVPPELERFLARVESTGTEAIVISFGSPYVLLALPEVSAYLLAWGGGDASQRAAADALLGRIAVAGRLPITLPPHHGAGEGLVRARGLPDRGAAVSRPAERAADELGMDPEGLARLDRILEDAVARGVTPGAAIAVGRSAGLARLRGYGRLGDAAAAPVTDSTLYDLASLTKVLATTTAVMRLVDERRLALDTPIGAHLPEWSSGWLAQVTVGHLLTHRGGLPPFRPFWRELEGREAYRQAIARLEPDYGPGERTVYSDIGFLALGFVVETITGRPLDAYLRETVFGPLGLRETGFAPAAGLRERIAPTEIDTVFRHREVRGEVHDENAYAVGGVAGHAGLFSSARDLARFAAWLLAAAREGRGLGASAPGGPTLPLPSVTTVGAWTRRAAPESSRALGWDTPSGRSSAGRFFTEAAFGHTGFTGTSLWIDPELDLFVVLLTNRVHPTRAEMGHIPLRRAVHDAAAAAIRDRRVEPRP